LLYTEAFTTDFIILDIEFNGRKFASDKPMEVIEIGAVRLNSALQATDEFSALVKPVYFSKLNGFIKSKTGIPQEAIDQAAGFPKVIADFIVWLDRSSAFTLVTWGGEDLKRIIYDTRMHRLDDSYWMSAAYFDLLKGYLRHAKVTNDVSVEAALTELGISTGGSAHRALDDARMTAEIFRTIFGGLDFNQAQHFKDSYTNSKERRMVTNAVRTMYAQNTVPNWDLFVEHFIKDKVSLADPRKAAELQNYFEAAVEKQRGQRRSGGAEDKNLQTTTKSK
jgi:inhibitor of KinA sporulation pathway (predicted exonuclease)